MLGAFLILFVIWVIAIICSAPLFIYRSLIHYNFNISSLGFTQRISFCGESWPKLPYFDGGVYYSFFSLALQYFIPIMVVTSAYMKIYFRLKKRFVVAQNVSSIDEKIQSRRGRRMKRTNCLLISIALIFGISWLPLNIFNLYADLSGLKMTQAVYITYAACHMAGMSSGKNTTSCLFFVYVLLQPLTAISVLQRAPTLYFMAGSMTTSGRNLMKFSAALNVIKAHRERICRCVCKLLMQDVLQRKNERFQMSLISTNKVNCF